MMIPNGKNFVKLGLGLFTATMIITSCDSGQVVKPEKDKVEKTEQELTKDEQGEVVEKAVETKPAPKPMKKDENGLVIFKPNGELGGKCFGRARISCIATSSDGVLYAVAGNQVKGFDKDNKEVAAWKLPYQGVGIAVDGNGDVFVAAIKREARKIGKRTTYVPTNKEIIKYSNKGEKLLSFGKELSSITSLSANNGIVAVGDYKRKLVATFDTSGKFLGNVGTAKRNGAERGQLRLCCGMLDCAVDKDGTVHVANLGNHCVSSFDPKKKTEKRFGKRSKDQKDFCGCCNPTNIAVSPQGYIITVEKTITRIKVYNQDGSKLMALLGKGMFSKGCSSMDVAVDNDFNIYAVDTRKNCVKRFSPAR